VKVLSTILFFLFVIEFASGQVPGTAIINNALFAKFTMSVGVNSTSSITFNINAVGGVGQITEVGVVYGIAKGLTKESTLCKPSASTPTFGSRIATINYTSNQWVNTINLTVLSTDATNSQGTTSFYVAPYYAKLYAIKNGNTYYGPEIEFLPNWPTVPYGGKTWLQANLGALNVATSKLDANSFGWYYQWGRATDGHQFKNSPNSATQVTSDAGTPGKFISDTWNYWYKTTNTYNNDVFNGNSDAWNGVNGVNNPCPNGWRLPTTAEWASFVNATITDGQQSQDLVFNSSLKLPMHGLRGRNGAFYIGTDNTWDNVNSFWAGDSGKPGWSWMFINGGSGYRSSDNGFINNPGPCGLSNGVWYPCGFGRFTVPGEAVRCVQN
jgi:hypothetical protein